MPSASRLTTRAASSPSPSRWPNRPSRGVLRYAWFGPQGTLDFCRLTADILCPGERLGLPGAVPPCGPHHKFGHLARPIDPPAAQKFDTVTTLVPLFCDPEYGQTRRTPVGGRMQTLVPGDSAIVVPALSVGGHDPLSRLHRCQPQTSPLPTPENEVIEEHPSESSGRPRRARGCPPLPVRGLRPVRLVPAEWTDPARVDRRDYR